MFLRDIAVFGSILRGFDRSFEGLPRREPRSPAGVGAVELPDFLKML
jgi:hypothetical protein